MAHAAPMLMRADKLHVVTALGKCRKVARLGVAAGHGRFILVADDDRLQIESWGLTTTPDLVPWGVIISDLVDEWISLEGQWLDW